jgi:signal transduction histidine kinase
MNGGIPLDAMEVTPGKQVFMANGGFEQVSSRLCDFLRSYRDEIVADFTERMRSLSPARDLSTAAIINHLPQVLTRLADLVESVHTGRSISLGDLPAHHAVDRLGRGFDFDQLVAEYGLLRRSILDLWEARIGPVINLAELRQLDMAFDTILAQSAIRYAQSRERLLKALDRVSEAALGSNDLDAFLQDLAQTTVEGTESVDTCVVLIREDDTLRVRAAIGVDDEYGRGYSIDRREGFVSHVAAEGRPVMLRDAARDPLVTSPHIRATGTKALYGVPLTREGMVLGVAHIGSLTASEFSDEDKLLFRTMVSRATSVVVKGRILGDLIRAETVQRFLSEASRQFAESLDYEATLGKIAHLAVPIVADWCVVDLIDDGKVRRVSVAHADSQKETLARELDRHYPTDLDAPAGIANVLRTGVAELRTEVTDAQLATAARDGEHLRMLRQLGLRSFIIVPITIRTQVVGTIALITAESNRQYAESDLRIAEELARRAATAIDNARLYTEAQAAIAIRERVLAIVSHDLRNQLGVIALGAELLERKASTLSPDLKRPVDTIRRTTDSMQRLVSDLVDMAAIQAGRFSFERQAIDLQSILHEAGESHEALARAKGLILQPARAVVGVQVMADRQRVLQVLANLLGNAIKYSDPGGVVSVNAEVSGSDVTIAVRDSGPGIPPEELDTIFEPYRTIPREGKPGTGLGLYIASGIVARHGGRIWVEGNVGHGATFLFTLPRAEQV